MALATINATTNLTGSALTTNAPSDSSMFATGDALGAAVEPGPGPAARATGARPGAIEKSDAEHSPEPGGDFAVLLASLLASPMTSTVPMVPSAEVAPPDTWAVSEAGAPVTSGTRPRPAETQPDGPTSRLPAELPAVEVEQQFAGLSPIVASLFPPKTKAPNEPPSSPDADRIKTSQAPIGEVLRAQSFSASTAICSPTPESVLVATSSTKVPVGSGPLVSTANAADIPQAGSTDPVGARSLRATATNPQGTLARADDTRDLATNADRHSLAFTSPDHSADLAAPASSTDQQPAAAPTTNQSPPDALPDSTSAPSLTSATSGEIPTSLVRALSFSPTATRTDDADSETSPEGPAPVTIGASVARSPSVPESRRDTRPPENTLVANIASANPHTAKPSPERAELPPFNADVATAVPVSQGAASANAGNGAMAAGRSPVSVATPTVAAVSIAPPRELADQLVTSAHRFRGIDGSHQMSLELNPVDLGSVSIRLTVEGSTISMQMNTERAATGDLLRSSLAELRSSLSNGGFTAGNLSVGHHSMSNGAQTGQQSPHPDFAKDSSAPSTSTEGMDARSNSAAQRLRAVSNRTGGSHASRLDVQL